MRILLAEDDSLIGEGLCLGLRHFDYRVDWVRDGLMAEQALGSSEFDALLLDLGLPDMDGMDLLGRLRRRGNDIPVLVLTARDRIEDRVSGLDQGADDYLVKPFDLMEVAARLRAITRRTTGHAQPVIEHGAIRLDPAARAVTCNGRPVALSGQEYLLLETLLHRRGRVVSRTQLLDLLYGWDEGVESNVLEVCIHHLRKKLGRALIHTVRGVGYIVPPLGDDA